MVALLASTGCAVTLGGQNNRSGALTVGQGQSRDEGQAGVSVAAPVPVVVEVRVVGGTSTGVVVDRGAHNSEVVGSISAVPLMYWLNPDPAPAWHSRRSCQWVEPAAYQVPASEAIKISRPCRTCGAEGAK